jgi:hypothetical protein
MILYVSIELILFLNNSYNYSIIYMAWKGNYYDRKIRKYRKKI